MPRLIAAERRRILPHRALSRSDITERTAETRSLAALEPHRGRGVALRTRRARDFELPRVLGFGLGHVGLTGQREQKRRQVVLLLRAQPERHDSAVEIGILHAALVVMVEGIPDRRLR